MFHTGSSLWILDPKTGTVWEVMGSLEEKHHWRKWIDGSEHCLAQLPVPHLLHDPLGCE